MQEEKLIQRKNNDDDDDAGGGGERSRLTSHRGCGVDRRMVQQPEEAARRRAAATPCFIQSVEISASRLLYLHATAEEAARAKDKSQRKELHDKHRGKVSVESFLMCGTPRPFLGACMGRLENKSQRIWTPEWCFQAIVSIQRVCRRMTLKTLKRVTTFRALVRKCASTLLC